MKQSKRSKRLKKYKKLIQKQPRHRVLFAFIGLVAAIAVGCLSLVGHYSSAGHLVTFHDRGQDHVILTRATTVSQALADAHISVAKQDVIEPAINASLLSTDSAVIINRARPVLVIDGALKVKVLTAGQSPNEIATAAGVTPIGNDDKTTITEGSVIANGASELLTIKRAVVAPAVAIVPLKPQPTAQALSKSKGAQLWTDTSGVTHRETYYDLPMNIVIGACGPGGYTIRYDGAKVDKDGYILVAANLAAYPKCSVVETSMGLGKVYDTGGFAARYPHGFDLATDWSNYNGS